MSAAKTAVRTRTVVLALLADAALVLVFAGVGRSSHARAATLPGLLETAWPFLAGLAIVWIAARVSKHPLSLAKAGVPVWLGTVALGLLLRWSTGGGVALPFVIVAFLAIGVLLLGWRAIAALVRRLRR